MTIASQTIPAPHSLAASVSAADRPVPRAVRPRPCAAAGMGHVHALARLRDMIDDEERDA